MKHIIKNVLYEEIDNKILQEEAKGYKYINYEEVPITAIGNQSPIGIKYNLYFEMPQEDWDM